MPVKTATKVPKVEPAAATLEVKPAAKPVVTPVVKPVVTPVVKPTVTPVVKPAVTPIAKANPEVKFNEGDADDEEEVKLENKEFYVKKLDYYNIKFKEYQEKLLAISNKIKYYKEIIDEL